MALSSPRFDRKLFLTWALGSTSVVVLGCSDAGTDAPAGGGSGGSGGSGSGGSGGMSTFPSAGSGGTFSSAGSNAGSGGTFTSAGTGGGGSGGAAGGSGGSAGGTGGAAPMASCGTQMKVTISANHGHVLNVTAEDVMAGVTKVYDTKGASMHEHWIQLTAADFAKLKAGGTVHKLSCNDGHEHEYIVNCVGNEKPDTTSGAPGFCDADHKCAGSMDMVCPELP
ncbi:MAG TPA: hypothetical protein VHB79_30395 [Polyangiaceae bacterium]|nr:hypothetical protein [Polyangiaceae bacterium]